MEIMYAEENDRINKRGLQKNQNLIPSLIRCKQNTYVKPKYILAI